MFLKLFLQLARDVPVKESVLRVGLGKQSRTYRGPWQVKKPLKNLH